MPPILQNLILRAESVVKGLLFDCRLCGQCVLSQTSLVCPMRCPKGLRNGPCGGTLDEMCEVYPGRRCVWVDVYKRAGGNATDPLPLLPATDPSLFHTSSYLNLLNGRDKATRTPHASLDLPPHRIRQRTRTHSGLERKLKEGRFVVTTELSAPRFGNFAAFRAKAEKIRGHFDGVNVSAYLHGDPSMPSAAAAAELARMGIEPIAQSTCRDQTRTTFVSDLIQNEVNGISNILCLTGDYYGGGRAIRQVFDMDSSLMLYEARYLAEKGRVLFTGNAVKAPPRPFLGAAINPFTTPLEIPIRRLKQKAQAGAEFIQTQLIFDGEGFGAFVGRFCDAGLDKELFLLAGVPLIVSEKAYRVIPGIPGVRLPPEVAARFDAAPDIREEGIRFARELIAQVGAMPGVHGVHLMVFGAGYDILPEVARYARRNGLEREAGETLRPTEKPVSAPAYPAEGQPGNRRRLPY